jgi:hypothetical protein
MPENVAGCPDGKRDPFETGSLRLRWRRATGVRVDSLLTGAARS